MKILSILLVSLFCFACQSKEEADKEYMDRQHRLLSTSMDYLTCVKHPKTGVCFCAIRAGGGGLSITYAPDSMCEYKGKK